MLFQSLLYFFLIIIILFFFTLGNLLYEGPVIATTSHILHTAPALQVTLCFAVPMLIYKSTFLNELLKLYRLVFKSGLKIAVERSHNETV